MATTTPAIPTGFNDEDSIFAYDGRPIGRSSTELDRAVQENSVPRVRAFLEKHDASKRPGLLRSYLEAWCDNVSRENFLTLLEVEPRLLCDEIAVLVVYNLQAGATGVLIERGWKVTPAFEEEIDSLCAGLAESSDNLADSDLLFLAKVRAFMSTLPRA